MRLPIEISTFVTLPQFLKEFRKQWSADDMIDEIIEFICDQPDTQFEDKLFARLQKFKADNE